MFIFGGFARSPDAAQEREGALETKLAWLQTALSAQNTVLKHDGESIEALKAKIDEHQEKLAALEAQFQNRVEWGNESWAKVQARFDAIESRFAEPKPAPLQHGVNCPKVKHWSCGSWTHDENHDGPYEIDGQTYCGRCHAALPAEPQVIGYVVRSRQGDIPHPIISDPKQAQAVAHELSMSSSGLPPYTIHPVGPAIESRKV